MPKNYDPRDWYWVVAGDETKLYSSSVGDYVQPTNASYAAWSSDGSAPTRIASEADLGEVLAPYLLRPAAAAVLDGYQDSQARVLNIQTVAKVLFAQANAIRVLQGQSALTAAQFRIYVKGLM